MCMKPSCSECFAFTKTQIITKNTTKTSNSNRHTFMKINDIEGEEY